MRTYLYTGIEFGFHVDGVIDAKNKAFARGKLRLLHPNVRDIELVERKPGTPAAPTMHPLMALAMDTLQTQPLRALARLIKLDMGDKVPYGAVPYLEAMLCLESIDDAYGCDPGQSIVSYFLCNATAWRGEVARRIKAELKRRL